jgi:transposase InsO family protein
MKKQKKGTRYEEAKELYHNKGLSIEELAAHYNKSKRTMYRWLQRANRRENPDHHPVKKKRRRIPRYPPEVFARIIEIKKELPRRSAPLVRRILQKDFPDDTPSLSTIRKFIRDQGLTFKQINQKQGYRRFQRAKPNDLWQIDIAGVQSIAHLGNVFLIALLDDCSRFVVAAEYFKDQKGMNVIKVIRHAIMEYGRPNQILADNGTQFRNLIGELGTKYTKLLEHLDVKPIFAKPHHPQTKGKLERWFGTVKQMFLVEARHQVKQSENYTLTEFNAMFNVWLHWYNTKKTHRGLPNRCPPAQMYFGRENRIYRPLKATVKWERWLHEVQQRKVTKCNEISYKSQKFRLPPGHMGLRVDVIEYEDKLEIYYKERLIVTHSYNVPVKKRRKTRKISKNGTIMYMGSQHYIDYKLAGKTVEVQEINDGKNLLVYLQNVLLTTLNL